MAATSSNGWSLRVVLVVLGTGALFAQEGRVSVASQIGRACGSGFPVAVVQQEVEAQLRAAGIAVSRVTTGALATTVECMPAPAGVSVQQCLSLSQAVPGASHANGMTLATTWRQCRAYTCEGRRCETRMRSEERSLVDGFAADFRKLTARRDPPAPPDHRVAAASGTVQAIEGLRGESGVPAPPPALATVAVTGVRLKPSVVFYALYILTCLSLLVRWQLHRQYH